MAPLLFSCAKTVSKLHLFQSLELLLERKQIPRIVVNVRISRKTTELMEITRAPWAQGVGRSNRPAPTNCRVYRVPLPSRKSLSGNDGCPTVGFLLAHKGASRRGWQACRNRLLINDMTASTLRGGEDAEYWGDAGSAAGGTATRCPAHACQRASRR